MKLWVDDIRKPPDESWMWARTVEQAKKLLTSTKCVECSLDHDMGLQEYDPNMPDAHRLRAKNFHEIPCGYDLAKWMKENERVPPVITVHSWNPHGAQKMVALLSGVEGVEYCEYVPFQL